MKPSSRRSFVFRAVALGAAFGTSAAQAQTAAAKLDKSDPQAVALGYVQDTTQVDAKKYPAHTTAQTCAGCLLFQGKPQDAAAPCTLFAGKQVAGAGWCSAWSKRAA
jgi:hypothetical protein